MSLFVKINLDPKNHGSAFLREPRKKATCRLHKKLPNEWKSYSYWTRQITSLSAATGQFYQEPVFLVSSYLDDILPSQILLQRVSGQRYCDAAWLQDHHLLVITFQGTGILKGVVVPYRHGGGWSKKINAWYLNTLMVYL